MMENNIEQAQSPSAWAAHHLGQNTSLSVAPARPANTVLLLHLAVTPLLSPVLALFRSKYFQSMLSPSLATELEASKGANCRGLRYHPHCYQPPTAARGAYARCTEYISHLTAINPPPEKTPPVINKKYTRLNRVHYHRGTLDTTRP